MNSAKTARPPAVVNTLPNRQYCLHAKRSETVSYPSISFKNNCLKDREWHGTGSATTHGRPRQENETAHRERKHIDMSETPKRRRSPTNSAGFTLLELVTVLMIIGVMTGIAGGQYTEYRDRTVPERAARVVGSYVSLTRSYAIQRRTPVTLVIDPTNRSIMIRSETDTLRIVPLGLGTDFELNGLDSNIDGDSLTFNGRGLCSVCGVDGNGITLTSRGTTYIVTFNALGRWKRTKVVDS